MDLYFGPELSDGAPESNWLQTVPGKGWPTLFRLYSPRTPIFDQKATWKVGGRVVVKLTPADIGAAILAVGAALRAKPGPAWPNEFDRKAARFATYAWAAVMAGNVVVGSEWYLMAVMLILLLAPVLVFVRAVVDATDPST